MKKLVSLLLAVAMLLSFAACGKDEGPTTEPAATNEFGELIPTGADGKPVATDIFGDPIVEGTEAPAATDAATEAVVTTDPNATTDPSATTDPNATTVPNATTAAPAPVVPQTTAEILALYNNAINSAYDAKAGFDKQRWVDNEKLDAGALIKTFGDLVYSFMGIGAANKYTMNVEKGKWEPDVQHHYLRKSTLSAADVTSATCTLSGDKYAVVINVKGGTSKASKDSKSTNAPIDKCGICVGDEDKSYYDHKTAAVIYSAIGGTFASAKIDESYSNAKIVAAIDASTGHIIKMVITYDISVAMDIGIGGGTATGLSHITYTNFKY